MTCFYRDLLPPATGDAFEDVLYGSESELDDSDDEAPTAGRSNAPSKRRGADNGARLRIDDDEPMDLLQGAASRITSKCCFFTGCI
jgi:ribosomal RNA-processing protein 12